MRVVFLVPRRAGVADRDRLWAFCRPWWERDFPDWPVYEGHHDEGPFNRSAAINRAAELANADGHWDVAVIIDADVLCDPRAVQSAVYAAASMPMLAIAGHRQVHISDKGTQRILGGWRGNWENYAESEYTEHWSSCVAVGRPLWELVNGFDELFVGWGHEDDAFRFSCETMGGHPMFKANATIWHLFHQRQTVQAINRNANRARSDAYRQALHDRERMRPLIERRPLPRPKLAASRIPRILHRTVPVETSAEAERFWELWQELHPEWEHRTWRDPLEPADWPITGDLFASCQNGAQLAGLVRLEALWTHGGVYADSDVEPYRSFEPLLHARGFAGWEDRNTVPDALLGAEPQHPAVGEMINLARDAVARGDDAWHSGPGVTTAVLPFRDDWLLLPPGSFYPYHYRERHRRHHDHAGEQPWAFAAHHWAGSWLSDAQRAANTVTRRSAGGQRRNA